MKKRLVGLAAAAMLLSACGGGANSVVPSVDSLPSETPSEGEPSVEPVVKHTVTFYVDGAVLETKEIVEGECLSFPADPTKDGYEFTGWYNSPTCLESEKVTTDTVVMSDMSIYAGFEELPPVMVTVTFDANGGVFVGETTVEVVEGSTVSVPADPTRDGYVFVGWSLTGSKDDLYNFSTPVTTAITLHAVWEEVVIEALYNITGTSESGKAHPVAAAADNNDDTYWQAENNTEEQSLTIDLGGVKRVTHVKQQFNDVATWNFTVKGSHDGEIWMDVIAENKSGSVFEADCNGYFRYVKLVVPASDNVATSVEFKADAVSLSSGSNVVKAYKGLADCQGAGYESENMFDGNMDTMHIEMSDHNGHYCGIEAQDGIFYYVKKVVFHMADNAAYKYDIDYESETGAWLKTADGSGSKDDNTDPVQTIEANINDSVNAILYHHYDGGGHWLGIREMEVYGFEEVSRTCTKSTAEGKEVYSLPSLTYIDRVKVASESENQILEVSTDGVNFEEVSLANVENGYVVIEKDAKYVRFSDGRDGEYNGAVRIFGTPFKVDLARGLTPTVNLVNSDPGYASKMATLNKDCKKGVTRMYCNPDKEGLVVMDVDLGKVCYVESILARVQDNQTNPTIKMKIEVEVNGEYVTLVDTFDTPVAGRDVAVTLTENHYLRNVRLTFQILNTWTNLNTLSIVGYGC